MPFLAVFRQYHGGKQQEWASPTVPVWDRTRAFGMMSERFNYLATLPPQVEKGESVTLKKINHPSQRLSVLKIASPAAIIKI